MSITLGLMLRVESAPVAVAVPPLQQGGIQTVRPVIEAIKIVEPTNMARSNQLGRDFNSNNYSAPASRQSALTYSRQGTVGASPQTLSGQLLNTYA